MAAGLLERGQHVILACRNMGRCQAVRLVFTTNFIHIPLKSSLKPPLKA